MTFLVARSDFVCVLGHNLLPPLWWQLEKFSSKNLPERPTWSSHRTKPSLVRTTHTAPDVKGLLTRINQGVFLFSLKASHHLFSCSLFSSPPLLFKAITTRGESGSQWFCWDAAADLGRCSLLPSPILPLHAIYRMPKWVLGQQWLVFYLHE